DVVVVLSLGVVAAGIVAAVLSRWPRTHPSAPRLPTAVVKEEVERHPWLQRVLRSRLDAAELTGLALTLAVVVIVLAMIGVGLLRRRVRSNSGLARDALTFARFGVRHATPWAVTTLRKISLLGGAEGVTILAVLVAIFDYRRFRSRTIFAFLLVT